MKYKVGDKVKIREDLEVGEHYGNDSFTEEMEQYKGQIATIKEIGGIIYNGYYIDLDDDGWHWTDEMFEDYTEDTEKEVETYQTVDVGFHLDYCGHKIIKNVYYGGYAYDHNHVFCTTVDSKNQYTIPVDAIDFIIPHEVD
jgi:hypothetical protein